MKMLRISILRAVFSLAIGAMLVSRPDNTITWIIVAIGVLFLLSGVISCVSYYMSMRQFSATIVTDSEGRVVSGRRPMPPIVGVGSVVLGFLMAINPGLFVTGLMYVLGAMLVLGALNQYFALLAARRIASVPWALWVCPSLVLLTGVYVLVRPLETAALSLMVIGWCSLLYGVTEIVNSVKIYSWMKRMQRDIQEIKDLAPLCSDNQRKPTF